MFSINLSKINLSKNKIEQPSSITPPTLDVAPIRPKIQLGISTKNKKPPKEIEDDLSLAFGEVGPCACCGVIMLSSARKTSFYEGGWFSVCQLCFYTENLDLIPTFDKGRILLQPFLAQTHIFTLLRAQLSHAKMVSLTRDLSPEIEDRLSDDEHLILSLIEKLSRTSGKSDSSNVDVVDTYVHMMDLLKDEDYEKRYMILLDMRWLPPVNMMNKDSEGRTTSFFEELHPEKSDSFVDNFVSKYGLPFSID